MRRVFPSRPFAAAYSLVASANVSEPVAILLDRIPLFRGVTRDVSELAGGLTNRNYKVTTPDGCFVVRVSPKDADLLSIDRNNEYRNSVVAAQSGVGAPVVEYLPDEGVLVVGFIDGVTFTDDSFSIEGNVARVAASCRRLHAGRRFVNDFNMFDIQRDYLRLVRERGFRLPDDYLEFMPQVEMIRGALVAQDEGTVPCNNDLLAGNFVDDGAQVWLIDYEYSGNNDACFELGNIWSECGLSIDALAELVTAYYSRASHSMIARARLLGLAAKYGWTLWGAIQEATSPLDFDFWSWAMERFEAAAAEFAAPGFPLLLQQAQRDD